MRSQEKPKSRLAVNAPQCARCRKPMKVRILFPGRKVDDVTYRCEECGAEVLQSVPRAIWVSFIAPSLQRRGACVCERGPQCVHLGYRGR
jgi:hypothetical protein